MAHGRIKVYVVCVSQDGREYDRVYTTYKEDKAESYRREYCNAHPEVVSAYIDRLETFKNNKRKDWEE